MSGANRRQMIVQSDKNAQQKLLACKCYAGIEEKKAGIAEAAGTTKTNLTVVKIIL